MTKEEYAKYLHKNGHNCSQSVICAFADDFGVDQEVAYRMVEGLGRGFGGREEICGAVSGMALVLGLKSSQGKASMGASKKATMALVNRGTCQFIDQNGTHLCGLLLAKNGTEGCNDLVGQCAAIAEELLKEELL